MSFAVIVVFGTYTDIPARAFYVAQVCICLLSSLRCLALETTAGCVIFIGQFCIA